MTPWERRSPDRPDASKAHSQSGDWRYRGRAYSENFQSSEWFSRGYLPHRNSSDLIQHVTFHLADSLPKSAIEQIDESLVKIPEEHRQTERRKQLDTWMDAGHGACQLKHPDIAELVQNSLLHFNGERYRLHAWVVMPNHVHVLFQPINSWSLAKIVGSWKKFTARKIKDLLIGAANLPIGSAPTTHQENIKNQITDRAANQEIGGPGMGPIWHREYWDRYIRDENHYARVVEYIHHNPVVAGLVQRPEDWTWSSARILNTEAGL